MEVKRLILGGLKTNCYIAYTEDTKKAVIIDPAAEADNIRRAITELSVLPEAVLLTHGHFDHMLAADEIRKEYHIPVGLLDREAELLEKPELNCSAMYIRPYGISADETYTDGQQLPFLDGALRVIATPGHTAGSACYYSEKDKLLFSGDTLFFNTVGRTDLPTSQPASIGRSIREKLMVLPEDVLVLCGHGSETTIGDEKNANPFL